MNNSLDEFAAWWTSRISILARALMRYETNQLSKGEITLPQFWVLERLNEKPCRMRDLARSLNMAFPAVTGLMDRMVKNGLAERAPCREDRRVVYAAITHKGRTILNEVYRQRRESVRRLFKPLTDKERAQYMEIVNKLVDGLSQ